MDYDQIQSDTVLFPITLVTIQLSRLDAYCLAFGIIKSVHYLHTQHDVDGQEEDQSKEQRGNHPSPGGRRKIPNTIINIVGKRDVGSTSCIECDITKRVNLIQEERAKSHHVFFVCLRVCRTVCLTISILLMSFFSSYILNQGVPVQVYPSVCPSVRLSLCPVCVFVSCLVYISTCNPMKLTLTWNWDATKFEQLSFV